MIGWSELGLGAPASWWSTIGLALAWLAVMLAYSPAADRFATRLVREPPTLGVFRVLQRSAAALVAGIVVAWALGGFLEEILLRGIVLRSVESFLDTRLAAPLAAGIAICVAAAIAGLAHLYQGRRGALVVAQLSVLFGVLYVISGYDLWPVILCHGTYDTIAFIRFARRQSAYSRLPGAAESPGGEPADRTGREKPD